MNWSEVFKWSLAVVSLIGVELNIRHRRECFYIWIFTNAAWSLVDFSHGILAQSLLHLVYFALAVRGILMWKTNATERPGFCDRMQNERDARRNAQSEEEYYSQQEQGDEN